MELFRSNSRLESLIILSNVVYTREQKSIELTQRCKECYESRLLELDNEVTLYRVYTRELNGELYTE